MTSIKCVIRQRAALADRSAHRHAFGMFIITEADAAAIRAVYEQEGELSAAIELRRLFPGIIDNAKARAHARTIAGWQPLPKPVARVTRLRPRRERPGEQRTLINSVNSDSSR